MTIHEGLERLSDEELVSLMGYAKLLQHQWETTKNWSFRAGIEPERRWVKPGEMSDEAQAAITEAARRYSCEERSGVTNNPDYLGSVVGKIEEWCIEAPITVFDVAMVLRDHFIETGDLPVWTVAKEINERRNRASMDKLSSTVDDRADSFSEKRAEVRIVATGEFGEIVIDTHAGVLRSILELVAEWRD